MRKRGLLTIVSRTEDFKPWIEVRCMECETLIYFEHIASPMKIELNVFKIMMKKHRCPKLKTIINPMTGSEYDIRERGPKGHAKGLRGKWKKEPTIEKSREEEVVD